MRFLWTSNTNLPTESFYEGLSDNDLDDDEVVRLCEEYFEIAIGIRKPTERERDEAGRTLMQGIFGDGEEIDNLDRIRIAKYPIDFSEKHRYEVFSVLEYAVFKKLAIETDKVDGPYIPMLRAELYHQLEDFEEEDFVSALIRQSACFETYCRMKLNRPRQTQWKHLDIQSISILEEEDRELLKSLRSVRDDYAHDWRVYITGRQNREELRDACVSGLGLLAKLHKKELMKAYKRNCDKHISRRYESEWRDRLTGTMESNASTTVQITCDNCGYKFVPAEEGIKRCPECDGPHDYLER